MTKKLTPKELLAQYDAKRDFTKTQEPSGKAKSKKGKQPIFVVQKHAATRLHWDFRLELDGVLKSWAVTNEPVADPSVKRLAVRVEDHPLSYATFAGDIPKGQYGGGHVDIWDHGTWEPHEEPHEGLEKGKLGFMLHGGRMQGGWALVRLKHDRSGKPSKRENWLLFKEKYDGKGAPAKAAKPAPAKATEAPAKKGGRAWVKAVTAGGPKKQATVAYDPELATRVDKPPAGDDWLHEVKFDGYRALVHVKNGPKGSSVQIVTRGGLDWTERFPGIAAAALKLNAKSAQLDGEIVAVDAKGRSDFGLLQLVLAGEAEAPLTYMAFDLLELDGKDLKRKPLLERKAALEKLLKASGKQTVINYSDHVIGNGDKFLKEAAKLNAEGIISKRADAPYSGKRGKDWLKIKLAQRQEFVIGGIVRRSDNPNGVGAILIGYHDNGDFRYAGRVGTGFAGPVSDMILERSRKLVAKTSPFTAGAKPDAGSGKSKVEWIRPQLVGEVEFTELTRDGVVRHGAFKGLREDKKQSEVNSLETAEPVKNIGKPAKTAAAKPKSKSSDTDKLELEGVAISHPDRIVYQDGGHTKGDIARYYEQYADFILPHLTGRPLSVMRCPSGSKGEAGSCFFQRHFDAKAYVKSAGIERLPISDSKSGEPYVAIKSAKGMLSLVQLGVIEFHPWNTAKAPYAKPDRLIFDLDPDTGIDWPSIREAAKVVRDYLESLGLKCWLKTTGGKGLHIVVPVRTAPDWKETKAFCRAVAEKLSADYPGAFTSNPLKAKRTGKIYLDYLRNDNTSTAVSAYSLRRRERATISTPITWKELETLEQPDFYTLDNIGKRLGKAFKDPWADMADCRQGLTVKIIKQVNQ